jgi:hypothetical protein
MVKCQIDFKTNGISNTMVRRPFRTPKIMNLPVAEATGYTTVPLQGTQRYHRSGVPLQGTHNIHIAVFTLRGTKNIRIPVFTLREPEISALRCSLRGNKNIRTPVFPFE